MNNKLSPLGMHQLLVIDFMKTKSSVTKKHIMEISIHKTYAMDFDTMMGELIEHGYVTQEVKDSRKTYKLNGDKF